MYQTSTPIINLNIPYKKEEIHTFEIIGEQQSQQVFYYKEKVENIPEFEDAQIQITDNLITLSLSQTLTKKFVTRYPIHLQVRLLLTNNRVVTSKVEHIYVHKSWSDVILSPED